MNNIVDLRNEEIPKLYGSNNYYNILDYIAVIRNKFPNPWETCFIIGDNIVFDNKILKSYNLRLLDEKEIKPIQEQDKQVAQILDNVHFVITKEMLNLNANDYGIAALVNNFMMEYSVTHTSVLIYLLNNDPDSSQILNHLREIYPDNYINNMQQIILPVFAFVMKTNSNNSINLTEQIDYIADLREKEQLTLEHINDLENYVLNEIHKNPNINSIVYGGNGGHIVLRSIISYLYMKYNLTYGISTNSLYTWLSDCNYTYYYKRMSLYERLNFVTHLPLAMKYLFKVDIDVNCRLHSYTTPRIINIYDYDTCEKINDIGDLTLGSFDFDDFIDFRTFFNDKNTVVSTTLQSNKYQKYTDYTTDLQLVDKFIKMDISANINIRNSIIVKDTKNNRRLLLHTDGDFILHTEVAATGIFKRTSFDIPENKFKYLFTHNELKSRVGKIPQVLDPKMILILNIFAQRPLYLSYFELALRWVSLLDENIYEGEVMDLFSFIPLDTIRNSETSRYFISSFGNPLSFDINNKSNIQLLLTNKFMSGKELPK